VDLRTDFVAGTADGRTQVQDEILPVGEQPVAQDLETPLHDPGCHAAPPRVQERHRPTGRIEQGDRDAVGSRDGQEDTGMTGNVSVRSRVQRERGRAVAVDDDPGSVHLSAVDGPLDSERLDEPRPPLLDLPGRRGAEEAEVEGCAIAPRGHTLHHVGIVGSPSGVAVPGRTRVGDRHLRNRANASREGVGAGSDTSAGAIRRR